MPEHDQPIPFYPSMPCHMAPLRPGRTPEPGCPCRLCEWASARAAGHALEPGEPVRPGTPEWRSLLALAGVKA